MSVLSATATILQSEQKSTTNITATSLANASRFLQALQLSNRIVEKQQKEAAVEDPGEFPVQKMEALKLLNYLKILTALVKNTKIAYWPAYEMIFIEERIGNIFKDNKPETYLTDLIEPYEQLLLAFVKLGYKEANEALARLKKLLQKEAKSDDGKAVTDSTADNASKLRTSLKMDFDRAEIDLPEDRENLWKNLQNGTELDSETKQKLLDFVVGYFCWAAVTNDSRRYHWQGLKLKDPNEVSCVLAVVEPLLINLLKDSTGAINSQAGFLLLKTIKEYSQRGLLTYSYFCNFLAQYISAEELAVLLAHEELRLPDPHRTESDGYYSDYSRSIDFLLQKRADTAAHDLPSIEYACVNATTLQVLENPHLAQANCPIILADLLRQSPILAPHYDKFVEKLMAVNERRQEQQARTPQLFLMSHQPAIVQLITIMGESAFAWLNLQLAESILPLERLLTSIPLFPIQFIPFLQTFFQSHKAEIMGPKGLKIWKNILVCIGVQLQVNTEINEKTSFEQQVNELEGFARESNTSLTLFFDKVIKKLLTSVLNQLEIDLSDTSDATLQQIFERVPPDLFYRLIYAGQRLQKKRDEHYEAFKEMLKCDLLGKSVHDFTHELKQESATGKQLAQHNQKIRDELTAKGFNVETLLHYPKVLKFNYEPQASNNTNSSGSLTLLLGYLQRLKTIINDILTATQQKFSASSDKTTLARILENINHLTQEQKQNNPNHLNTKENLSRLGQINTDLTHFLKNRESASFTANFYEFAQHYVDGYKSYHHQKSEKPIKPRKFRVEQWSKEKVDTFSLGDYVSCCLSTTNDRFHAMVQRRMDDAMIFHVVVDEETNQPVALSWLYLAEGEDNQIYLVANFVEIAPKYGANEDARKVIIDALLHYTGEMYLPDNPQIKNFLIRQMDYGHNVDTLNHFESCEVKLKNKVGGACTFGSDSDDEDEDEEESKAETATTEKISQKAKTTMAHYYLESLRDRRFHRYDSNALSSQEKARFLASAPTEVATLSAMTVSDSKSTAKPNLKPTVTEDPSVSAGTQTATLPPSPALLTPVTAASAKNITLTTLPAPDSTTTTKPGLKLASIKANLVKTGLTDNLTPAKKTISPPSDTASDPKLTDSANNQFRCN